MAYGALFNGSMTGEDGREIHVFVDREGYSGTTYPLQLQSDRLVIGQSGGNLFASKRRSRSAHTFVGKGTPIEEAKKITRQPYGTHRVRVEHDQTEVYRGFVDTDKTSTKISEQRGLFNVRAKVGLNGFESDWRQSNGAPFTGDIKLSVILADIFDAIGLAAPLDAVLAWRPSTMSASSDPLSIQAQSGAWKRENTQGQTNVSSRGEVLSDVVGIWGASLFFENGKWQVRQPMAYQSGSTVTVHEYDASGAHQGTRTETATVDVDGDPWERDSDEVSGVIQSQTAAITYKHGAPQGIEINGSFEQGSGSGATGWTFPTADFDISTSITATSDSDRALEIEGEARLANSATIDDMRAAVDETADTTLGGYASDSESVDITLNYRSTVDPDGGIDGDQPELIRMYWAAKHVTTTGTTYWLTGGNWTKESNLSSLAERLNGVQAGAFGGSAWAEKTITIPSPPLIGTLSLEISEPISRQQSSAGDAYDFHGYWDEISLSRSLGEGAAETLFRASDPAVSNGEVVERTFRIGDGPYEESPGALLLPSGGFTGSWRVVGENDTYALHELLAKEIMASLRGGAQLIRADWREPTRPKARRAVTFDGLRYWPVHVEHNTANDVYSLSFVELRDEGHPPNFSRIPGGESSFDSGAGGSSGAESSGSWSTLTGKPDGLLAKGGGDDGVTETTAVPAEVSSYRPGVLPADATVFSHLVRHGWTFETLLLQVGTDPSVDFDFTINVGGTTQTVTLNGGDTQDTYTVQLAASGGDLVEVTGENTRDGDLADVRCAFDVSPV